MYDSDFCNAQENKAAKLTHLGQRAVCHRFDLTQLIPIAYILEPPLNTTMLIWMNTV